MMTSSLFPRIHIFVNCLFYNIKLINKFAKSDNSAVEKVCYSVINIQCPQWGVTDTRNIVNHNIAIQQTIVMLFGIVSFRSKTSKGGSGVLVMF